MANSPCTHDPQLSENEESECTPSTLESRNIPVGGMSPTIGTPYVANHGSETSSRLMTLLAKSRTRGATDGQAAMEVGVRLLKKKVFKLPSWDTAGVKTLICVL